MVIPLFMVKRGGGDDGSIGTCAEKVRMCARERILFFDNVFLFFGSLLVCIVPGIPPSVQRRERTRFSP